MNSSNDVVRYFTSEKTWGPLFKADSENAETVLSFYNQILLSLPSVQKETESLAKFLMDKYQKMTPPLINLSGFLMICSCQN